MTYTVNTKDIEREYKLYKDKDNNTWQYLSVDEYKKLPNSHKRICGDLRKEDSKSVERVLKGKENEIGLYEYKPKFKWNEEIIGYIPVSLEDDENINCCVRILGVSKMKTLVYPLFLLLIFLSLLLGALWLTQRENVPGLDKTAVAYNVKGMENPDPTKIMMPLIQDVKLKKGETKVKAMLANARGNPCYMKFIYVLEETNDILYETGLVKPGEAVLEFDLKEPLPVGKHNVSVKIINKDIEDITVNLNGGEMKTVIEVVE